VIYLATWVHHCHRPCDSRRSWAAYVAGTLLVLMHECVTQLGGASLAVLVASDVPPGETTLPIHACICYIIVHCYGPQCSIVY